MTKFNENPDKWAREEILKRMASQAAIDPITLEPFPMNGKETGTVLDSMLSQSEEIVKRKRENFRNIAMGVLYDYVAHLGGYEPEEINGIGEYELSNLAEELTTQLFDSGQAN